VIDSPNAAPKRTPCAARPGAREAPHASPKRAPSTSAARSSPVRAKRRTLALNRTAACPEQNERKVLDDQTTISH